MFVLQPRWCQSSQFLLVGHLGLESSGEFPFLLFSADCLVSIYLSASYIESIGRIEMFSSELIDPELSMLSTKCLTITIHHHNESY